MVTFNRAGEILSQERLEASTALMTQSGAGAPSALATYGPEIENVRVRGLTARGLLVELGETRDGVTSGTTIVQFES